MSRYKTIGILGGMGPEATSQLFKLIITHTEAKFDQEHIPIIINNNPLIPDRTEYILTNINSPLPDLIVGLNVLEKANVDFVIIPCNTSHYFIDELQTYCSVPILNMIKITSIHILESFANIRKVGLLATTGTVKSEIYDKFLIEGGLEIITPSDEDQESLVMEAIYGSKGIKAGYKQEPRKLLQIASENLIKQGADLIILGCTELSIVLKPNEFNIEFIDPLYILAKKAIEYSKRKPKLFSIVNPQN